MNILIKLTDSSVDKDNEFRLEIIDGESSCSSRGNTKKLISNLNLIKNKTKSEIKYFLDDRSWGLPIEGEDKLENLFDSLKGDVEKKYQDILKNLQHLNMKIENLISTTYQPPCFSEFDQYKLENKTFKSTSISLFSPDSLIIYPKLDNYEEVLENYTEHYKKSKQEKGKE